MERPGRVCVCVLNWNGWRDTIECLESVLRSDYPDYQVVVVDNGSDDASLDRIRRWAAGEMLPPHAAPPGLVELTNPPIAKPVRSEVYPSEHIELGRCEVGLDVPLLLIRSSRNLGFAGGMNVGLRYAMLAGFEYVWLLNNDTVIAPDALRTLVTRAERDPQIGICGSTLLEYDNPLGVQALGGFRHNVWLGVSSHLGANSRYEPASLDERVVEAKMDGVQGASMLVSKRFLQEVGLLSEDYFLYFEEHDWAARARRSGFRLGYSARSVVYHKEGRSTGGNGSAPHRRSRRRPHRRPAGNAPPVSRLSAQRSV
jgi:GT2 family glycosyltransferase